MTTPEIIAWAATAGAIIGVILNNHRLRACFIVWLLTNTASCALHILSYIRGDHAMLALAARDAIFIVLALHGYILWGKKKNT